MSERDPALVALCTAARGAARRLAPADRARKDAALTAMARRLRAQAEAGPAAEVLAANAADLEAARSAGTAPAMVDRLMLDPDRLRAIARAVDEIATLDDPVGEVLGMKRRPSGILVGQVRIPLGVICMIYEARPNVTVDAAALCLKSGNAVLLRGGREAARSNLALGSLVTASLAEAGLPEDAVQLVPPGDRNAIRSLVGMTGAIDLVIPRGGEGLIRFVAEHARVPVIQHYKGVCHLFVDEGADLEVAARLVENGKLSRPGVCNALECVLIDAAEAPAFLPRLGRLIAERGLEVRGDDAVCAALPGARPASEADWGAEFLAPILAARVVSGLDAALDLVARFGSGHTEVIVTRHHERAQRWLREVDASCVMVNASTRFNDGGELGLGAEIGISTTKLHAYGPMGLASLTALKWVVYGEGQVR
jgi:glutamate-5-semialdehyde dehydrogenase